jgi:hypothetical protein
MLVGNSGERHVSSPEKVRHVYAGAMPHAGASDRFAPMAAGTIEEAIQG